MAGIAAWAAARGEQLPHGSRARYVALRCRCDACRAANSAYYHQRQAAKKAAALEAPASADAPGPRRELAGGRVRSYRRGCPGLEGEGACLFGSYLRKDSTGGRCARCRDRLASEALIDAAPARAHLLKLRKQGVGRRAVSAASDVSDTLLSEILARRQRQIRPSIARRILAVDVGARADGAIVSAARTWQRIRQLLEDGGFTKAELARRFGFQNQAIQWGQRRILARTAARVERFYLLNLGDAGAAAADGD